MRAQLGVTKQHQACVRRRALLSLRSHPGCPDDATAERVVNEVWESCFADTRPFDEVRFRPRYDAASTDLVKIY